MVTVVPGHAHLSDHPGTGLLEPGNEFCRISQILPHSYQRHANPGTLHRGIVGQAVEHRPKGADLHHLQPGPAHVRHQIQPLRDAPVLYHAIEPEVFHMPPPNNIDPRYLTKRVDDIELPF